MEKNSHAFLLLNFKESRIGIFTFFFLLFLNSTSLLAQEGIPVYDELNVEMTIPDLGVVQIPIAIKEQEAFLPVSELLDYLKIKNEKSGSIISGFIIHPDSIYQINPETTEIQYKNITYQLSASDFVQTPTTLYLKSNYFGEIFGLNTDFSFRSLSLKLATELELPIIKEMRLKKMRENLDQVKGIIQPDTTIERSSSFFRAGMLDWGITATQQSELENDNRLMFGLGTFVLGGEANVLLNYSTRVPFDSRNQFYQWRYVNNENKVVKQLTAGRIFAQATSSLFAPVAGIQLSNTPLQNRQSFGTYTINDYTEPRWTVELYVNNVLVDFTEADASGFYTFDVPLMYGNTKVNLRFYGPWGQERVEERLINIPYNFVPKNKLEYTFSAGLVEDEDNRKFSRIDFHYGLNNSITVGGGMEYLTKVSSGEFMPFLSSSMRLFQGVLFSGEYMYGVKGEGILSYHAPGNIQVNLNYVKYHEDQTAINFNYLEERIISLSAPIRGRNFSMFSRFSINQIVMPTTKFTTSQLLLSGMLLGINTNLTTYAIYNDRIKTPTVYSSISQTYRLPYQFLFSPQLQYDFKKMQLNNMIIELERPVFNDGFLNVAYENNFNRNSNIFQIGMRYTFGFAQTALSSRIGNRSSSFVQSARGSLMFDDNTGHITSSSRTSISKAALTIVPFLDYNVNGQKDPMEPPVPGVEIKGSMGRLTYNEDETIIQITGLQPYIDVVLEIDQVSLDNIAWKVKNPVISVETVPNHFKTVYVPVEVLGEVAGMVYIKNDSQVTGQGRIIVNILDEENQQVARILSEGDGYFTYLGLAPGKYTATIDPGQLKDLGYSVSPEVISFEIEVSKFGDIVDTLEFVLEQDPSGSPE